MGRGAARERLLAGSRLPRPHQLPAPLSHLGDHFYLKNPPLLFGKLLPTLQGPGPCQLCSTVALPVSLLTLVLTIQCRGFFQPVFVVC